jgi:RNA-binding protein YhbY
MLDIIDQLKNTSSDIGENFMIGIQNGINETFINELAKHIAQNLFNSNNIEVVMP